ncbi:MAG: hypothetical protein ACO4B5_04435, partial [Steroidobacteraceae bacterium]
MKKLPTRMLPALAVAPVLFSSTAVAGVVDLPTWDMEDAGTLLGGEGFGRNELVILAVVMAV